MNEEIILTPIHLRFAIENYSIELLLKSKNLRRLIDFYKKKKNTNYRYTN